MSEKNEDTVQWVDTLREKTPEERAASLPPFLRLTREQIKAAEKEQKELAERYGSPWATPSPADWERARAPVMLEDARMMEKALRQQVSRGGIDKATLKLINEKMLVAKSNQAEAHAALGRFDTAAIVEPNPERAREYAEIHAAIMRDDSETCDCGPLSPHLPITQEFRARDVYSIRHGRVMPLVKCNACGFPNVKPLPRELEQQQQHRAAARALTLGLKEPGQIKAKLEQSGHTAKRLLLDATTSGTSKTS